MVQAVVNLNPYSDRVLNLVKAIHGFKRKDEAINFVLEEYGEAVLEPELKPEYVKKALRIHREKGIEVGTVENLRKRYEL